MIHNHGPEEGAGLSCNELRLPGGRLIGLCLLEANALGGDFAFYRKGERVVIEEAGSTEFSSELHHSTETNAHPGDTPGRETFYRRE